MFLYNEKSNGMVMGSISNGKRDLDRLIFIRRI